MAQATKLPPAYLEAVKLIKNKGFGYFKLELEAQLGRGNADYSCDQCDDGWNNCEYCEASGIVYVYDSLGQVKVDRMGLEVTEECDSCNGQGQTECRECNGRGRARNGASTGWCQNFIEQHMGSAARKALVFGKFYDDGSVDSEYTFTMAIEDAHLSVNVIKAFRELNTEINGGGSPNVDNAGMHVSILPSGKYPCKIGLLNTEFMENFRCEVTKLLPALYFVATHTNETRRLEYRLPEVSSHQKYSAIYTHGDTCIEFRIFDTCYEKPTALLEKIQTVAATLCYYSNRKVKVKYKEFRFPSGIDDEPAPLSEWYENLGNLDALNQTLKYLKPKDKSLKTVKEERKLTLTRKRLFAQLREGMSRYKADYLDHVRRMKDYNVDKVKVFVDTYRSPLIRGERHRIPFLIEESSSAIDNLLADEDTAIKYFTKHSAKFGIVLKKVPTLRDYTLVKLWGDKFEDSPSLVMEDI